MTEQFTADDLADVLRATIVAMVRREGPDLPARQFAVLLTCYLRPYPQTVRGLAADLNVAKPAITRALDRLTDLDLVRRTPDPLDRRSVHVQPTAKGTALVRELRATLLAAARAREARNLLAEQRRAPAPSPERQAAAN